ncbi:polymorphic toxin type 44 domain-containing protein [Pseudomonas sp. 681]|uniref:Polymorphic toxin type 44 domain-containing protein n=1 Tax=Pseudomonas fungipugnans TaxID=3024217 RepID=A0ABT6QWE3_9PSED|nr:polymorphic toxin type 44 domain-containing protein [Pseudomonas sp. 681]MDI2595209.1 polymorphic toxin type 44 domain-containing protein [Pseudomonas sp. 681]
MSDGYFIGQGDKTTCGGMVLDGDPRVDILGLLHACEGDRVSCGVDGKTYQIYGGISHMESHGRLMAGTLDSFSGCPCRAQLIPSVFTASYQNQNEARPVPQAARASAQPASYSDRSTTTSSQQTTPKPAANYAASPSIPKANSTTCNHPDQMEALATYIAGEMNTNIHDPAVLKMKELINYDTNKAAAEFLKLPWYARLAGPPDFNTIAWTNKLEAMVIWTQKVGQDMEWDHKPKLRKLFPGVRHKQGQYDYYYDIWSNIHYGYVGIIGGLSESVLLDGAGAEQIVSDSGRKAEEMWKKPKEEWELPGPHLTTSLSDGLRAFDDAPDRVSVSIGVKLANHHPHGGITAKMVMDEVLAVAPENWGDGIRVHECN